MNKIMFFAGIAHSMFVFQAENWKTKIRPNLRFFLSWLAGLYALAIVNLLSKLPDGSLSFLIENSFHPIGAVMLVILAIYSLAGTYAAFLANKLQSSL